MTTTTPYANPLDVLEEMDPELFDGMRYLPFPNHPWEPRDGSCCAIGELSLNALIMRDGLSREEATDKLRETLLERPGDIVGGMYELCQTTYGLTDIELEKINTAAMNAYIDDDSELDSVNEHGWSLEPVLKTVKGIVSKNGRWH